MLEVGVQTQNVITDENPYGGFELLREAGFTCCDFSLNGYLKNTDIYRANKNNFFDDVLSRFVEGTYSDYALSKLISKELIESEFSETSFSAGLLSSLLNEPKEAQLAYELLKSLKEGK